MCMYMCGGVYVCQGDVCMSFFLRERLDEVEVNVFYFFLSRDFFASNQTHIIRFL